MIFFFILEISLDYPKWRLRPDDCSNLDHKYKVTLVQTLTQISKLKLVGVMCKMTSRDLPKKIFFGRESLYMGWC